MGASLPPMLANRKDKLKPVLLQAGILAMLYLVLYAIDTLLPPGFDWQILTTRGPRPNRMPWTGSILSVISLPSQFALTAIGFGLRTRRSGPSLLANWLGPDAWHFGNLLSLLFWLGIQRSRNKPSQT